MKLTLFGTRGSIACAGPQTLRYGGDTSAIELRPSSGGMVILDAGSGIRQIGPSAIGLERIDVLVTHLHMDHVQGLPFFTPLLDPDVEVHIWGPISTTSDFRSRIARYLSPPLFPVRVRELNAVFFHDVVPGTFAIGSLEVTADLICHPGETLGYRLSDLGSVLAYMPDHEPAFGSRGFPDEPSWTSGYAIAEGVDVLIHDAQYTDDEYPDKVGWGHTSHSQLLDYAAMCGAARLMTFHHDPSHSDEMLDEVHEQLASAASGFEVVPGKTGLTIEV